MIAHDPCPTACGGRAALGERCHGQDEHWREGWTLSSATRQTGSEPLSQKEKRKRQGQPHGPSLPKGEHFALSQWSVGYAVCPFGCSARQSAMAVFKSACAVETSARPASNFVWSAAMSVSSLSKSGVRSG